jgi:hypothetical protein
LACACWSGCGGPGRRGGAGLGRGRGGGRRSRHRRVVDPGQLEIDRLRPGAEGDAGLDITGGVGRRQAVESPDHADDDALARAEVGHGDVGRHAGGLVGRGDIAQALVPVDDVVGVAGVDHDELEPVELDDARPAARLPVAEGGLQAQRAGHRCCRIRHHGEVGDALLACERAPFEGADRAGAAQAEEAAEAGGVVVEGRFDTGPVDQGLAGAERRLRGRSRAAEELGGRTVALAGAAHRRGGRGLRERRRLGDARVAHPRDHRLAGEDVDAGRRAANVPGRGDGLLDARRTGGQPGEHRHAIAVAIAGRKGCAGGVGHLEAGVRELFAGLAIGERDDESAGRCRADQGRRSRDWPDQAHRQSSQRQPSPPG